MTRDEAIERGAGVVLAEMCKVDTHACLADGACRSKPCACSRQIAAALLPIAAECFAEVAAETPRPFINSNEGRETAFRIRDAIRQFAEEPKR